MSTKRLISHGQKSIFSRNLPDSGRYSVKKNKDNWIKPGTGRNFLVHSCYNNNTRHYEHINNKHNGNS